MKGLMSVAVLAALLAGCTMSARSEGVSMTLLRDAMVESARVAAASENPEPAIRAVVDWRGVDGGGGDAGESVLGLLGAGGGAR